MSAINLAIVGVGKIVRDQHLPSIAANADFKLVATASRNGTVDGVTAYTSIDDMLDAEPSIDAVSLCMPPQYRYEAAYKALSKMAYDDPRQIFTCWAPILIVARKDVMGLEKTPYVNAAPFPDIRNYSIVKSN